LWIDFSTIVTLCTGTNPLCFGIPTDEEFPFVIDCATSINQRGECLR
jgi:LDH2 family malate/lactate/ureidoglycolate dehydrogenase